MRIIEACIYVSDVDSAEDFYSKLLGIKPYAKVEGGTYSSSLKTPCF